MVQYAELSVKQYRNSLYAIRYTLYAIRCTLYAVRYTLYAIRYTLYATRLRYRNLWNRLGRTQLCQSWWVDAHEHKARGDVQSEESVSMRKVKH